MISRVANKAVDTPVVTISGTAARVKFLNFIASGIELLRMDKQAVTAPDSPIVSGDIFSVTGGPTYIVIDASIDYFKSKPIRKYLTLITANNAVTVIRPSVQSNGQGGISGHTDVIVAQSVPCKLGTFSTGQSKQLDVNLDRFVMLMSRQYTLQKADTIKFAHSYETAKVEGIKHDNDGVIEVIFDRDPRWTSA